MKLEGPGAVGGGGVGDQKGSNVVGDFEPLGIVVEIIVEAGEGPEGAALRPDELVGASDGSVVVNAIVEAAVFGIDAVLDPEGHHIVDEVVSIEA